MSDDIVLASASPRRLELLQQIGIRCTVHAVEIDESSRQDEPAIDYVSRLARQKAQTCVASLDEELALLPVLAADTIVELDGELLGKPIDSEHAYQMLTRLSGTPHFVHTAVAVCYQNTLRETLNTSRVQFGDLSDAQIREYIISSEPMDKAGAYGIQGRAAAFIKHLDGSFSSVMGLPLYETARLLTECGVEMNNDINSEFA